MPHRARAGIRASGTSAPGRAHQNDRCRTGVASVTATDHPLRRTGFGIALNLVGMGVACGYLLRNWAIGVAPAWTLPIGIVVTLAWLAALLVPARWRVAFVALVAVMTVGGAITSWPTNGLMIIPLIAGLIAITSTELAPVWLGYAFGVVAAVLVATTPIVAAATGHAVTVEGVLSLEFAVAVAVLAGVNRRQSRARQAAAAELAERTASMREEQAKASTLAARQSLARDMHDVLAHSLGGLVIQLDAVEAQLEAGKTDAALARLGDARSMAASGLAEARRAVEALRAEPDAAASVSSTDLAAALIDLVDAHERLGGVIEFEQSGAPRDVPDALATALRRALQESLSNARKHAPGLPVTVRIRWRPGTVELVVSNPVPTATPGDALAASGGGRGLLGMRERFDELPDGEVTAARVGDTFVVRASARLPVAEPGESEDAPEPSPAQIATRSPARAATPSPPPTAAPAPAVPPASTRTSPPTTPGGRP